MEKPAFWLPAPLAVPAVAGSPAPAASPAQQAFRLAVLAVEDLRGRLQARRQEQAAARRRYWQQVGPVAAAVVAARRALYAPLEAALLLGSLSRLEEGQLTELILSNARVLEARFGEDETAMRAKYAPRRQAAAGGDTEAGPSAGSPPKADFEAAPAPGPAACLPPHEQAAAAARARRQARARRAPEAAARTEQQQQQQLAANTKTLYRQLARAHHPDLERDPTRQAAQTAQMQRITAAYEADDLYALLQLLAESGPAAGPAADDVLARYTHALHQQQARLEQELHALRYGPEGLDAGSTGKKQERELRQLKRDLRAEAEYVAYIAGRLREPAELRKLLRELSAAGHESI